MAEPTLAEVLLGLAEQDALGFRKLANDPDIRDALVGFHAQQAVEKALKAYSPMPAWFFGVPMTSPNCSICCRIQPSPHRRMRIVWMN